MDFASRELAKYGWEAGSGLGANQDGIKKPGILSTLTIQSLSVSKMITKELARRITRPFNGGTLYSTKQPPKYPS